MESNKEKYRKLRDVLSNGLLERETPIRLAVLAALAGEHLLLLGLPGTAKSELARRLKHAFKDATYFERLLTKFSVPEELFGPLSIKGLEEDRYERLTQNYLPESTVAFIDEVFKANSAILNSLLTLLNEREFDNGAKRIKTPLMAVIGASNELPEGEELNALYDRFLLRYQVNPVSQGAFKELLNLSEPSWAIEEELKLTPAEILEIQTHATKIPISSEVLTLLQDLRLFLQERQIYVSDRRWRKIAKLLRTAAWSNGTDQVSVWDCWLLQHCVWEKPEQQKDIFEWYQARVGTKSALNPERCIKVVMTWERKLKDDKSKKTHRINEDGDLLYLDYNGKLTTKNREKLRYERDGNILYLGPSTEKDRSNQNQGYTKDELKEKFFRKDYHNNWALEVTRRNTVSIDDYIQDRENCLLEEVDYEPFLENTSFSKYHIQGCLNEVEVHQASFTSYLKQLDQQIDSVVKPIEEHLWISPGFSELAKTNLQQTRNQIEPLLERLQGIFDGYKRLPQTKDEE